MEKLIIKDSTVEKAIQKGLIKLNISLDDATVVVKEEGKKGIFGFGKKDAVIEISPKEKVEIDIVTETIEPTVKPVETETLSYQQEEVVVEETDNIAEKYAYICEYLENVANAYGAPARVEVKETAKKLVFQIESEKAGLLIGKHGKIINALQVLAQTLVYREDVKFTMVSVNIGDYRSKREDKLKAIADRTAERVLRTKQPVFLEPLPASERKIIHARLSRHKHITTHSEGNEPYRYLVVELATQED